MQIVEYPKLVGYWRSPHGMYRYAWYEKPTRMFKFAAWMLGWKWEDA